MLKAIVLCASLLLPAVAFAAPESAAAPAGQTVARARNGSGVKSLKGTRARSRAKRQSRSNGAASNSGKASRHSRRARGQKLGQKLGKKLATN